ncbi:MAG: helix-turn-helix domain-containing protein [Bacteroidaceae bacterium]|nr:helix-turn-helix domain-containing protein [Bacteroidaceae bacterium]
MGCDCQRQKQWTQWDDPEGDKHFTIKNGGKLGRKPGSVKTSEQKREEYKEVISLLRKGYSVRNVAKLGGISTSTVQRIKKEFAL